MNERDWKRIFSRVGLACAGFLILAVLAQYLIAWIFLVLGLDFMDMDTQLLISSAAMYLLAFPAAAGIFKTVSYPKPVRAHEKWTWGVWGIVFLICVGTMMAGNLIGRGFMLLLGSKTSSNAVEEVVVNSSLPVAFLTIVATGPVVEELLMRKLVIDRILIFGEKTAVIVSGFFFGLLHGNFYQFFYAFALGMIFGYVYVRTGKVRNTIILHILVNFMGSVLLMGLLEWGSLPGIAGIMGILVLLGYELCYLAASVGGIVLLIAYWKKIRFYQTPYEWSAPAMTAKKRLGIIFGNFGVIFFLLISLVEFAFNL